MFFGGVFILNKASLIKINYLAKNEASITHEFDIQYFDTTKNTFKFYYQTPYGSSHESNVTELSKLIFL